MHPQPRDAPFPRALCQPRAWGRGAEAAAFGCTPLHPPGSFWGPTFGGALPLSLSEAGPPRPGPLLALEL